MLKRKRKRELSSQDSTPISAMIDIVFLLLIYFILTQKPIIEDTRPTYLNHIGKNNKETQLIIFCADNVKHADLVKALDLCRLSSLSNISIMAK